MSQPSANVTLGDDLRDKKESIPCFLCRGAVCIRHDKNQKPYFICEGCGIQAFIRGKQGIALLQKLQRNSFLDLELIQLSRELALWKSEKEKIASRHGFLGLFEPDEELIKAEQAITQKIKAISEKIKKLTEKGNPDDRAA